MWPFNNEPIEMPYRLVYEPAGVFIDKNGNITCCTAKKSYGYWGNLLSVDIEKTIKLRG